MSWQCSQLQLAVPISEGHTAPTVEGCCRVSDAGFPKVDRPWLRPTSRFSIPALLTQLLLFGAAACRPPSHSAQDSRPHFVGLFIMDTVRRDLIQPCGYDDPATPNLARLATEGTTYCGMVAPGSWTLPVHASIFTGLLPPEHGADFSSDGVDLPGASGLTVQVLDEQPTTLAEIFSLGGYQTVLVSGNPLLQPATGLARGFEIVSVESSFDRSKEVFASPRLRDLLENGSIRRDKPLFLVVNIITAHGPYEQVPPGVAWLEPTPGSLDILAERPGGSFLYRYYMRKLGVSEPSLLEILRRNYTWGVAQADRDLGEMLQALEESGWLRDDSVLAVTSDHGEGLGQNGVLDHGRTASPEVLDVFALLRAPGFERGRVTFAINQSQDLFNTILECANLRAPELIARRPGLHTSESNRIAVSFSEPDPSWAAATGGHAGRDRLVAVTNRTARAVWSAESGTAFEGDESARAALEARLGSYSRLQLRRSEERVPVPDDLLEDLKALGYL